MGICRELMQLSCLIFPTVSHTAQFRNRDSLRNWHVPRTAEVPAKKDSTEHSILCPHPASHPFLQAQRLCCLIQGLPLLPPPVFFLLACFSNFPFPLVFSFLLPVNLLKPLLFLREKRKPLTLDSAPSPAVLQIFSFLTHSIFSKELSVFAASMPFTS